MLSLSRSQNLTHGLAPPTTFPNHPLSLNPEIPNVHLLRRIIDKVVIQYDLFTWHVPRIVVIKYPSISAYVFDAPVRSCHSICKCLNRVLHFVYRTFLESHLLNDMLCRISLLQKLSDFF